MRNVIKFPAKLSRKTQKRPKIYIARRLLPYKWKSSGWILPPEDYEDNISSIVNGAFDEMRRKFESKEVQILETLDDLLDHHRDRTTNMIIGAVKNWRPSRKTKAGITKKAALFAVTAIVQDLFCALYERIERNHLIDERDSKQSTIGLSLEMVEEKIVDELTELLEAW